MMDSKQERLRERYEDALFAIMMEELASSLGQEALEENERLKNDPAAAVPEQIEKKCMQTIHDHYRKAAVKKAGRVTLGVLGKTAMVFGLASAMFFSAFALSEDVRIGTMNLIVETFGESTDFHFAAAPSNSVPQIKAGWVPEGFELKSMGTDEMSSWLVYENPEGHYIKGAYTVLGDGQLISVDTEDAEIIPVPIHDIDAMMICKGSKLQIAWETIDKRGFVEIFCNELTAEELIKIAENIKY